MGFRDLPYMGVIHVVAEAAKLGFQNGAPDWCNLGQGQPEVGPLPGAPERLNRIDLAPSDHAYGPINGSDELRTQIAAHYNRLYRQGRQPYHAENVAVVAGGRLALSRLLAAVGEINLGYQTPDYTAYEDLLDYHRHRFNPVHLATEEAESFRVRPDRLVREIKTHRLGGFLLSNPCNPTGEVIAGAELAAYVAAARTFACTLILDEFYSHYVFDPETSAPAEPVSGARYVEDVNEDPVILVDGLTKNFRYPGWRLGWIVGPRAVIETVGRAASAIDGGPPLPMQRAALEVLQARRADQELSAMAEAFGRKRALMRARLSKMGLRVAGGGAGTFYCWASAAGLPAPFNDSQAFFRAALARKVMVVPGEYFDVDPGHQRRQPSRFRQWLRFSFGPSEANMMLGLDRLEAMLAGADAETAPSV